jgi:hypothetical protein
MRVSGSLLRGIAPRARAEASRGLKLANDQPILERAPPEDLGDFQLIDVRQDRTLAATQ